MATLYLIFFATDPAPKKVKSFMRLITKREKSHSKAELLHYKVFKAPLHMVIANDQLPEIIQVSVMMCMYCTM